MCGAYSIKNHNEFQKMLGSWKNKIVAPELLAERAKINFDKAEMYKIIRSEEDVTKI